MILILFPITIIIIMFNEVARNSQVFIELQYSSLFRVIHAKHLRIKVVIINAVPIIITFTHENESFSEPIIEFI